MAKDKNYLRKGIKKTSTLQKIIILILCAFVFIGTIFYLHYKDQKLKEARQERQTTATEIVTKEPETTSAKDNTKSSEDSRETTIKQQGDDDED